MIFPDYKRSVLNVPCSILGLFGAPPTHETLPEIIDPGRKTHVALVILDGLGEAQLSLLPESAFLRKHRVTTLTSVFPSTTTAATNSLYSALSPAEHGWLGWYCYFKEYNRTVDLFLDRDSYSKLRLATSPAWTLMAFPSVFDRIRRATFGRTMTRAIFPFQPGQLTGMDELTIVRSMEHAASAVRAGDGRDAFTIFYWPEPDATAHSHGAAAAETVKVIEKLNNWVETLAGSLKDTTLIVTADHGLTDIAELVYLDEHPEIMRFLIMPPTVESRAVSLFVKRGREAEFEAAFLAEFGEDFLLMPRAEVLSRELFGPGPLHPKADDFLGDYMALAVGGKAIAYRAMGAEPVPRMIGYHAGLTEAEMLVPLILA